MAVLHPAEAGGIARCASAYYDHVTVTVQWVWATGADRGSSRGSARRGSRAPAIAQVPAVRVLRRVSRHGAHGAAERAAASATAGEPIRPAVTRLTEGPATVGLRRAQPGVQWHGRNRDRIGSCATGRGRSRRRPRRRFWRPRPSAGTGFRL